MFLDSANEENFLNSDDIDNTRSGGASSTTGENTVPDPE